MPWLTFDRVDLIGREGVLGIAGKRVIKHRGDLLLQLTHMEIGFKRVYGIADCSDG
jgi:hypothetical protein